MAEPIVNPELPYVGDVPSGLQPGKMLRFQGVTHPNSDRFNINLATGPNAKPRDDTALHLSVRLNQGYIARNTYKDGSWGDEQGSGRLPIGQAQSFEIIILVEPNHYKIAVNGQHFYGDVSITLISFEGIAIPGSETSTQASQVHAEGPQGGQFGGPQYGPPPGAYGAPPPNYGGYGPPPPPGSQPQSEFGGFLEQAQDILAGAIKSGAAEKLLGSILHSSGQPQQQPQGYAPQNARYGIYPDLPTQDTTQIPPNLNKGTPNPQDSDLSNLIAGAGGTITTGPAPTIPSGGTNPSNSQQKGPLENLLSGLLSGQGGAGAQPGGAPGHPQNPQSGGSDVLSGLLSSLLSGNQQTGSQNSQAQAGASQGSDVLSGILSGLLSNQGQQTPQGPNQLPNVPPQGQNSGQRSDMLSGILSSLLSSNQNQQGPNQPPPNTPQSGQGQGGGGDVLSGILQNLIAGNNQPQNPGAAQGYNQPANSQNPSQGTGTNNAEMLSNLLQGLLSKAGEQHNNTRPIQETNPSGPPPQQDPQQQYGQYPHAQQQEQKGPMESLLSGLLSGGGQQQHQQPHGPQFGGEGSVGGLGSMGGILGSLAGSLLHRPDQNQGH